MLLASSFTGSIIMDVMVIIIMVVFIIMSLAPAAAFYIWIYLTIKKTKASFEHTIAQKQHFNDELTNYLNQTKKF